MSLIKCPKCNGNVSTMAGTCPGCGVRIKGNLIKCSNCGSYQLVEDEVCHVCGTTLSAIEQTAETSNTPTSAEDKTEETFAQTSQVKRTGLKWATILVSIIFALLLAAGAATYYYYAVWQNEAEAEAYSQVMQVTNPALCQDFLNKYPFSPHSEEVEGYMQKLEQIADEWQQIKAKPTREAVMQFLQDHPESAYYKECSALGDSIDWAEATKQNTEEAVQAYINNHPSGSHQEEALKRMTELKQCRVTPQNMTMLRSVLESFLTNAFVSKDETLLRNILSRDSIQFCGLNGVTAKQIVNHRLAQSDKDVIGKHYMIQNELDIKKSIGEDDLIVYDVKGEVVETTNRSDATKNISSTYKLTATLNNEYKIAAISIQ